MTNPEVPIPLSARELARCIIPDANGGDAHVFLCAVPTQVEKDRLNLRLYELGVLPVSTQTMRATIVNELFEIRDEDQAEELADRLAEYWRREEIDIRAEALWDQQEAQRMLDIAEGAPYREPYPAPPKQVRASETFRHQALLDELDERSDRYRRVMSRRAGWQIEKNVMMLRITVRSTEGDSVPIALENDILPIAAIDTITKAVGQAGLGKLITFVAEQYGLSAGEEKNSGSPVSGAPTENGSTGESDASDETDGSATGSNIEPDQTGVSATGTTKSSGSTSRGSKARKGHGTGRTAAA